VLVGLVEQLWYVADRRARGREVKLPTTRAQIVINLDADQLTTRPSVTEPAVVTTGPVAVSPLAPTAVILDRSEQRRTAGIVLCPEALGAVAGVAAESLEVLADATEVWGPVADHLAEVAGAGCNGPDSLDRIEAELAAMLRDRTEPDAACRAAISHLRGAVPVGEAARRVGLSQSTLVRRFRAAVGMTPKRYQRLLRLERVIMLSGRENTPDWAAISADCGYADQSHMAHEFTDLTSFSPTAWRCAVASNPFHVAVDDFLQDGEGDTKSG